MLKNYALTEILNSARLLERLASRNNKHNNKLKLLIARSNTHQYVVSNIISSSHNPLLLSNLTLTSLSKNAPCTRAVLGLYFAHLWGSRTMQNVLLAVSLVSHTPHRPHPTDCTRVVVGLY